MSSIIVCPLNKVKEAARISGATHMLTLLGKEQKVSRPDSIPASQHLHLSFSDVTEPTEGFVAASASDIEQLIEFVTVQWKADTPLLIHCWMGISRSTAGAFIALCANQPHRSEFVLARALRSASPSASPNRRLVEFADKFLGRDGRMNEAIRLMGRGSDAFEGTIFEMFLEDTS
ncbi:MAG: tyrosine protein phosphatase [Hyphomicrobiales bacterium]|nr:MAG: tyrosine protein phosphatase [Hyphomicrobiales bacterium]